MKKLTAYVRSTLKDVRKANNEARTLLKKRPKKSDEAFLLKTIHLLEPLYHYLENVEEEFYADEIFKKKK